MLGDLAALTPPAVVGVAFLIGLGIFLRHRHALGRGLVGFRLVLRLVHRRFKGDGAIDLRLADDSQEPKA